jgi:DNA-binding XRE family transcriptional regulator
MTSQPLSGQASDSKRNLNLLTARLRAGFTLEQLAKQVGMSRQAIHALEVEGGRPHPPNAKAIADALEVDQFDLWPLEPTAGAA